MWLRGPVWDGFWFLSGVPFGVILLIALVQGASGRMMTLSLIILVQTAHLISPMVVAWTNREFRAYMMRSPIKFIVAPLIAVVGGGAAGYFTGQMLPAMTINPIHFTLLRWPGWRKALGNPFMIVYISYLLWNGYHFGKQNFGVLSLYRRKREAVLQRAPSERGHNYRHSANVSSRTIDLFYCCGVTWAAMLMPFIPWIAQQLHDVTGFPPAGRAFVPFVKYAYISVGFLAISAMLWRERATTRSVPRALLILTDGLAMVLTWFADLWAFAVIGLTHWLTAVGLASHVQGNHTGRSPWLAALMLIGLGIALFTALFVRPEPYFEGWRWLSFTVTAVGVRLGLGFAHFLYDRWVYKLSDPRVRATIGREFPA